MTSFPLFSHLKSEVCEEEKDLSIEQKMKLVENIKKLNEQGCSLVYALIRYYQIFEAKDSVVENPFGMKKIKTGYRFCIDELPSLLQNLIYRFVEIHLQSQNELSSSSSSTSTMTESLD
jgi:hypothetical protein